LNARPPGPASRIARQRGPIASESVRLDLIATARPMTEMSDRRGNPISSFRDAMRFSLGCLWGASVLVETDYMAS